MTDKRQGFVTFSPKQMKVLCWWHPCSPWRTRDAIICDGAVRSGKTVCLAISFVTWAMASADGASFALCGKTLGSLRRNLVTPVFPAFTSLGFRVKDRVSKNMVEIEAFGHKNRFYLFGGRDESSAALIQGITLSGVLFDEVVLMPRSFVEQALARCSAEGSRFFFNCNPGPPMHWFHEEWIKKAQERNALYLHFTMEDNPSLSPAVISRYEKLYSGAFYERFVRGRWVAAGGIVYPMFSREKNVRDIPSEPEKYMVSCDYGTVNPSSFGLWGLCGGRWYRMREYYHDSRREGIQKTDEEHYEGLCELCEGINPGLVICDPSAASFIECINRHGRFRVMKADNDVLAGIRRVADALRQERIFISPACTDTIREFSLYRWEENGGKDAVKKENDHAMDDIRYFVSAVIQGDGADPFGVVSVRRR